jgi:hypothetical protein
MFELMSKKPLHLLVYFGEPSGTRTRDPVIKSHMLYRPELTAHKTQRASIITGYSIDWKGSAPALAASLKSGFSQPAPKGARKLGRAVSESIVSIAGAQWFIPDK